MSAEIESAWKDLQDRTRRFQALSEARALLEWDQLTMMPPKATESRGEQSAVLAGISHQWITDPRLVESLQVLETEEHADPIMRGAVRNVRRACDRATKLPSSLVEELERARLRGHTAWVEARKAKDYKLFAPRLAELVRLARQVSSCLASAGDHPYDPLLDAYEPGARVADVKPVLDRLAAELRTFLRALDGIPAPPEIGGSFPVEGQKALFHAICRTMGYDFDAGRLDVSVHPFTVGIGSRDVRITTRHNIDNLGGGLFAAMHEAGHALYEMGIPPELRYLAVGEPLSTGIHESQSRFWENHIGGSRAFMVWLTRQIPTFFPGVSADADVWYRARNRVVPTLVRVEADEATYNLHILIRFRLEVALLAGELDVTDLEAAWNQAYREDLGINPPSALEGVLQDVHWSEGLFGYFPTYTLGNLYGASMARSLGQDVPDLWDQVARGEFGAALRWMRQKVHVRAGIDTPGQILADTIGQRDMVADFMDHLWERQGQIYGVRRPL